MKPAPDSVPTAPLVEYFNRMAPLSRQEMDLVTASFHPRLYRKKQFVLQEGDVSSLITFVVKGCLRMYKVDDAGAMHIMQFAIENWWISDLGSFYKQSPSVMNIEAIEESAVLQISHADLLNLYERAPKFNLIFRVLMENNVVRLQERLLQNISTDARVRYELFLKQYPNIVSRVPNTNIASFLGITPEFLSRIRNERVSRKQP